jgi:hypothetical protein
MESSIMDKQTQENGQQAVAAQAVPNTHFATLVRGEFYALGNATFTPGKRIPVPQYIKDHLERTAVDVVDVEGEGEAKQKFAFEVIGEEKGEAPRAAGPARRRTTPREV